MDNSSQPYKSYLIIFYCPAAHKSLMVVVINSKKKFSKVEMDFTWVPLAFVTIGVLGVFFMRE